MARLELTIKTDYLPNWKAWEGVRELLQNGKDAETEQGATLDVRYRKDTHTLVIENEGAVLPKEALLLGHTTKVGRTDTIGHFGEGLKLGVLALVRQGLGVKIRSGSEVWTPRIEHSDRFDADVLVFHTQGGREDKQRVQIEVTGLSPTDWETIRDRFLFLRSEHAVGDVITTNMGRVLQNPKLAGRLYVKGIFVSEGPYNYGYDLQDAELDRDRKMVDPFDLRWKLWRLWGSVVSNFPEHETKLANLLMAGAKDVEGVDEYAARNLPKSFVSTFAEMFQAEHGKNALPVRSLAESAELEHLGMAGVVTNANMLAVLEASLGSVEANKQKLHEQPQKLWGYHELGETERRSLREAIDLVAPHEAVTLADVDVVTFRDSTYRGMWKDGRILLSQEILADEDMTLRVLVHEAAHKAGGGDGEKSHVSNIERIWCGITRALRNRIQ